MILNNIQNQDYPMQIQDYINAGKIASEVRENARKKNHIGSTLFEICESIEKEIIQKGGAPAVIRTIEAKLATPADSRS